MNLFDAKAEFHDIVERHCVELPLGTATRAQVVQELDRVVRRAMRQIDQFTAEQRDKSSRHTGQNTRNGLLGKLEELRSGAAAALGLD